MVVTTFAPRPKRGHKITNARTTGQTAFTGRKRILLTLIGGDRALALSLSQQCRRCKMDVRVHVWQSGTEGAAGMIRALLDDNFDLWLIAGGKRDFAGPELRRSLSLAAAGAADRRGIPTVIASTGGAPETLPGPLASATVATGRVLDTIISRLHEPPSPRRPLYRLAFHYPPHMGLWVEFGPESGVWQGALCGVAGEARPLTHAVSNAGKLLEQHTMETPRQDLRFTVQNENFTAWSAGNELTPATSYFVRLSGLPGTLLFGPFPQAGAEDLQRVSLS